MSAGAGTATGDPFDQMVRRGQGLAESERAGGGVERRDVGERAADVGGEAEPGVAAVGRRFRFGWHLVLQE